jgi:hypothetical protein
MGSHTRSGLFSISASTVDFVGPSPCVQSVLIVNTEIPVFRYCCRPWEHLLNPGRGGNGIRLYNVELVRLICRDINNAKDDPQKEQELISLLQAVIREDQEEMRIRMAFLAKKYAAVISDAKAAD